MTPLVANLKHFYQSKKLLFWGIFISGFCLWLMFLDEQKFDLDAVDLGEMSSFFSGMSVVLAFLGVLAAEHQRHIFSKPFVSFLPGHHRAAWRVLFLIGCIVSVVLCLVELLRVATIQLNAEVLGMVGCACVLGFVCYTLGVFLVFPCGVGGIVPFFLLVSNKWAKPENLRYCLVDHPYMSVSVSCVALVAFWVWFACNKNLVKYCCERPYYGFMSNTKVKSQKTAVEEIMPPIPKSRYADRLERYCQNRMLQAPMFSMPRTLWGAAYELVTRSTQLRAMSIIIFMCMVLLIVLGYIPERQHSSIPMRYLFFYLPTLLLVTSCMTLTTSGACMALGRRERFYRLLWVGGILSVALLVFNALFVGLSQIVVPWMPKHVWGDVSWRYIPIPWLHYFLGVVILPLCLLREQSPFLRQYGPGIFIFCVMALTFGRDSWNAFAASQSIAGCACLCVVSALLFCGWALLLKRQVLYGDLKR